MSRTGRRHMVGEMRARLPSCGSVGLAGRRARLQASNEAEKGWRRPAMAMAGREKTGPQFQPTEERRGADESAMASRTSAFGMRIYRGSK